MKQLIVWVALIGLLAACQRTYYVVRHAEKAQTPQQDPPLTERGELMAQNLKTLLQNKKIQQIFSTNTKRTLSTAAPLSTAIGVQPQLYTAKPDSAFVQKLLHLKGNTLVVGHSNTVDDIVNALCGRNQINGDLDDKDYGGLFVVTIKGKKASFKRLGF